MTRFLVIQLADIGDLVLSTPALSALREAHPDAHIALLTTAHAAPIVAETGLVDDMIAFDKHAFDRIRALLRPGNLRAALRLAATLRRGQYDTILFLHHFSTRFGSLKFAALSLAAGSPRRIGLDNGSGFFLTQRLPDGGFGARHQAQYWLDLVGLLGADSSPRPAQIATAAAPELPPNRKIAVHAGSGGYSTARRWDAARFAAVAAALSRDFDATILLVGGPGDDNPTVRAALDAESIPVIDLTGQTTLPQLAAALSACDLFIGADSGVMHIAAAVGTPVVAIFGPSNAAAWSPWGPGGRAVVLRSAPICSPCSYVGTGIGLREGCPARTCMRMVTVEQVVAAARGLLGGEDRGFAKPISGTGLNLPAQPHPSSPSPNSGMGWVAQRGRAGFANETSHNHGATTQSAWPHTIRILGLPVAKITYAEWLDLIGGWIAHDVPVQQVCTINPEFIMIAQHDVNFRHILGRAALCVPDGVGLLWAARHIGERLPQRVTGSDGVPIIAEAAARQGWRLFLLGAAPGVADQAAAVLRARYPGVQIVGTYSGSPDPAEEDAIVERVNTSKADILFVAYGAPQQDKWIARNAPRLRVSMAMGVGGSLDFIAGVMPRAPLWMQRLGLEWLFRLYLQPRRIGRMMRLPRFVLAVLRRGRG